MYNSDILEMTSIILFLVIPTLFVIISYILTSLVLYNTAKTNGMRDLAFVGWFPFAKSYLLFTFSSSKPSLKEMKDEALKFFIAFIVIMLFLNTPYPYLGLIGYFPLFALFIYAMYRVLYRWSGHVAFAVFLTVLSIITFNIVFGIYGLAKMKKPFTSQ